ncbi:MAG: condensation domain-containing protein [Methylocella sp.]
MTMRCADDLQDHDQHISEQPVSRASTVAESVFPCSTAQQRFWFIDALDPASPSLNIALRWEITGQFSPATIEKAFQTIVERHEVLRTRIVEKDGDPMQEVAASYNFKLTVIDLTIFPEANRLDEAMALAQREARLPFHIDSLPLIRATMLRLATDRAFLLVTVHHVAFDGASIGILAREFGDIVSALDAKHNYDLPELPLQYGDFCLWQKEYFASGSFEKEIAYWKKRLTGAPYFRVRPDRERAGRPTHGGEILGTTVPKELGERLEEAACKRNMTLFSFCCAVVAAMLHRFTDETDIVFGTQIAGRDEPELENLIGVFINDLVLRFDASGDPTFAEFLPSVNETVLDALIHQRMPFQKLVEILNPPRDSSRTPLISVNFTVLGDVLEHKRYGDFNLSGQPSLSAGSLYDLNLFLVHWPSGWRMAIEFDPSLFERDTAERMLAFLMSVFEFAVSTPGAKLSALTPPVREARDAEARRTDLAAVEALLLRHADVKDAVAAPWANGGDGSRSYAYVAPAPDLRLPLEALPAKLKAYLEHSLPPGDAPAGVSVLLALPRTAGGDVDYAALPPPRPPPASYAPSGDGLSDAEAKVAAIWRELLNVDAIAPTSNFFELGGHSLLTIRLINRISSVFGVKADVMNLFQAPTLREFAASLSVSEAKIEAPPDRSRPDVSRPGGSRLDDSRIVKIQSNGDKTPIIAIHNTFIYYNLSRELGLDRPFLGVQLFDPSIPRLLPPRGLSELAADYVRIIREAQPHGPYILLGLCVPGAIAYEAAQQLRKTGELVPLVVMADAWRPDLLASLTVGQRFLTELSYKIHVIKHRIGLFFSGKQSIARTLAAFTIIRKSRVLDLAAWLRVIDPSEQGQDDRGTWLFMRYLEAAKRLYRASPSTGDVVILRSDEIVTGFSDPSMGWSDLVNGRVIRLHVPGWHEGMFQDEGATVIAECLRPLLEEIDAKRSASHKGFAVPA